MYLEMLSSLNFTVPQIDQLASKDKKFSKLIENPNFVYAILNKLNL